MKTKDVIAKLQEADPSGELECVVFNHDIVDIYKEEGYWDGCAELLVKLPDKEEPQYNTLNGKVAAKGWKVQLITLGIEDIIELNEDASIEYDSEYAERQFKDKVAKWRQEMATINSEFNLDNFFELNG